MDERWVADMTFLCVGLSVLVKPNDRDVLEELLALEDSLASGRAAGLCWFKSIMSPQLFDNFFDGYRKAVLKYGIAEGNRRIREKTIEILLKNRPDLTRQELIDFVVGIDEQSRKETIKDVFRSGIHLVKNADGTYTEEE